MAAEVEALKASRVKALRRGRYMDMGAGGANGTLIVTVADRYTKARLVFAK